MCCKILNLKIKWSGKGLAEKGIDTRSKKILVKIDKKYFRPNEVDYLLGDSSKASSQLGWKPTTDFESLVKMMVESDIELAKREKKEILILINRANAKSKLIKEAVKFVNDMKVKKAKTILGNRQIFVSSMGLGLTVVEKQRTGKGCLEMLSLAKEIQSFLKI